jgi:hypothetical protein
VIGDPIGDASAPRSTRIHTAHAVMTLVFE